MAFARSNGGPVSISFFFETDGDKRAFIEGKLGNGSGHGKPMAGKRDCISTMDALRKLDPTDPAIGDKLLAMMEGGRFPEDLTYGK